MTLHYVEWDSPKNGRKQRAMCGVYVDPEREHANRPTCERCRQELSELVASWEEDETGSAA